MSVMQRRAVSVLVVLAAALAAGWSAKGFAKPMPERGEAHRSKGPENPKAVIVEFSDFQCPACRAAQGAVKQVLDVYGADAKLIFKHFPLERMHPWARPAATAAECAGRQGKFWAYHDVLYERQDDWANEKASDYFRKYARELKLDEKAWSACLAEPSVQKAIDADVQEARDRWVGGTPTFFINGKRFVNGRQLMQRGARWLAQVVKK